MKAHMKSVKNRHACDVCGKGILGPRSRLELHKDLVHRNGDVRKHHCVRCNKKYLYEAQLKYHNERHHGPGPPPKSWPINHHCQYCDKGFNSRKTLNAHNRTFHTTDKRFKCDKCDRIYVTQSRFDEHLKHYHPPEGQDTTVCSICKEKFPDIRSKVEHFVRNHKPKSFSCDLCPGLDWTSRLLFYKHLQSHRQEKKYLCSHCGMGFAYQGSYETHLAIVCNSDGKERERLRDQRAEIQRKYRARVREKSYQCKVCKTGFLVKRKLDFHTAKFHKKGVTIWEKQWS